MTAMKADRLLRLYPRAWRDRYGDEFLALLGDRPVRLPQIIDIVSGAIDAHVSSDIRAMASRGHVTHIQGGTAVMEALKQSCIHDKPAILSKRDAWIGASVMVAGSIVLSALGIWFNRAGFETFGEAVKAAAFPVSVLLSMPFTFVKGRSWKAQCVLVGLPLAIVLFLTYVATML
jgi:hypothetical protein